MPGVTEDEAVRIFIEFDRIDSAIKGRFLHHLLTLYSITTPFDAFEISCMLNNPVTGVYHLSG